MYTLRDYQEDCNEAVRFGHQEHDSVLIELATGLGKTVMFTKYAAQWQEGRTLVIAPLIALIGQAAKKIEKETGEFPAIEQADQWSDEDPWNRQRFVVASKQTLCSGKEVKRYERFQGVGLVIVDEAHYACTEQYAELIKHFRGQGAKILGVTATAKRHDKRALEQVFDECCYQMGICEAIDDGWLVPIKVTCKQLENLDLSGVQTSNTFLGKDFNQKQLAEKLEDVKVIYEIAEAIAQETRGEKTAVFCASVNEAQAVSQLLVDSYQIKSDWICADTQRCTKERRLDVMSRFGDVDDDSITHCCNVGILRTGWDFPGLKTIVMAQPTKSLPLYTQVFGRVTRPIERDGRPVVDFDDSTPETRKKAIEESDKPHGRVIDLVDNSLRHKLKTALDVLGGKWTLVQREEILESMVAQGGAFTPEEMAEDQKKREAQLRRMEEEERQERLRRQRASREANATFRDQDINPFGGNAARRDLREQRVMLTDKQRRYLWVLGFKDIDQYLLTKAQAGRIITHLKGGATMVHVHRTNRLQKK